MNTKRNTAIAVVVAVVVVGFFLGGLVYQQETPASVASVGQSGTSDNSSTASSTSASTLSTVTSTTTPSTSMITTADGLQMQDEVIGTGPAAKDGDHVYVNYIGTLTDGTKFDSSYDRGQPIDFTLGAGQVIPGWEEGLVGMQAGGKRELIIPPTLGYGNQAVGPIPANSTLVFQVELVKIGN